MSAARALADAGARDESAGAGDGGVKMHGDGSGSAVTSTNERRAIMKRSDEKVEETEVALRNQRSWPRVNLAGREVAEAVSVARRRAAPAPPEPSKTRASPCRYRIGMVASAYKIRIFLY